MKDIGKRGSKYKACSITSLLPSSAACWAAWFAAAAFAAAAAAPLAAFIATASHKHKANRDSLINASVIASNGKKIQRT